MIGEYRKIDLEDKMNREYEKAIQLLDNMIDAGASSEEILNLPQFGVIANEQPEPHCGLCVAQTRLDNPCCEKLQNVLPSYPLIKAGWRKLVEKEGK